MNQDVLLNYYSMLNDLKGRKHLLLGNGFSINCATIYSYNNLFKYAQMRGFTPRLNALFDHFGTTNFERVVRTLNDTEWVSTVYEALDDNTRRLLHDDVKIIKEALVGAVANTHLDRPSDILDGRKQTCVDFLLPFHNIFTTNYDLLLYWVHMYGLADQFEDGFRESIDEPNADYVVFSQHLRDQSGMFYLHGAMHLYEEEGQVRKHCWERSQVPLKEMVLKSLDEDRFPMFVAEGEGGRKLEQIQASPYMSYCLGKLKRCTQNLVVYGSSLGDSDEHILNTIGDGEFQTVCLGVFGDHDSTAAKSAEVTALKLQDRRSRQRRRLPLKVLFYDMRTANVWDPPAAQVPNLAPWPILPTNAATAQISA